MNKTTLRISVLFYSILLASFQNGFSQIAGSNCFLKGNYVQLGINSCGAYGSNSAPPAGYTYDVYSGLGFTADGAGDGWGTGSPVYCGDYFVPGSPVEGWGVQIGASTWFNTDQYCSPYSIPGSITSYTYAGGTYSAKWEGDLISGSINIHITQETLIPEDSKYIVTRIYFCNNGASSVNNIYYMRNVDPDQDEPWSYDFTTYNVIVDNPPVSSQSLVTSQGLTYGCFLGMGAIDPNSRVSYGNFFTNAATPKDVYLGTAGYSSSGTMTGDIATSIAFKISTIPAGECKCISFAYILNSADLTEALDATSPASFAVEGVDVPSGDTIVVSAGVPVTLDVLGIDGYTWTWTPAATLDSPTGSTVHATVYSNTTYTVTGTGSLCGTIIGTVTLVIAAPLPIQLSYFDAQCMQDHIDLNWATLSEVNTDKFTIEKSTDGFLYNPIGQIQAAGFSNEQINYTFTDYNIINEKNYYRLKQCDVGGEFVYTNAINISCDISLTNALSIVTSSIQNLSLQALLSVPESGAYGIELFDITGREIFYNTVQLSEGSHAVQMSLPAGVSEQYYIVVLSSKKSGHQVSAKCLKTK